MGANKMTVEEADRILQPLLEHYKPNVKKCCTCKFWPRPNVWQGQYNETLRIIHEEVHSGMGIQIHGVDGALKTYFEMVDRFVNFVETNNKVFQILCYDCNRYFKKNGTTRAAATELCGFQ